MTGWDGSARWYSAIVVQLSNGTPVSCCVCIMRGSGWLGWLAEVAPASAAACC